MIPVSSQLQSHLFVCPPRLRIAAICREKSVGLVAVFASDVPITFVLCIISLFWLIFYYLSTRDDTVLRCLISVCCSKIPVCQATRFNIQNIGEVLYKLILKSVPLKTPVTCTASSETRICVFHIDSVLVLRVFQHCLFDTVGFYSVLLVVRCLHAFSSAVVVKCSFLFARNTPLNVRNTRLLCCKQLFGRKSASRAVFSSSEKLGLFNQIMVGHVCKRWATRLQLIILASEMC